MHLAVGVSSLLCELLPGLGLGQELTNCALRQAQDILGKEPLTNVVDGEELSDPPGHPEGVKGLSGILLHVVPEHVLKPSLHRV